MSGGQDELLQAEGTVILHITFALKQDQVCSVNVVFSLAGGCCVAGKNDKETQYTLEFAARDQ